jgi:SHS2 domain-containing protein
LHARGSLLEKTVGYTFLPHTTDAYVQATGTTIEEAFAYAAIGLMDTMCNIDTVAHSIKEELFVEATDEVLLLYNWLELLHLKFELEHKVFSSFEQLTITRKGGMLFLKTKAAGENYDRKKHGAKVEVKAVTLHRMEVVRKDQTTAIVRFILDL